MVAGRAARDIAHPILPLHLTTVCDLNFQTCSTHRQTDREENITGEAMENGGVTRRGKTDIFRTRYVKYDILGGQLLDSWLDNSSLTECSIE